MILRRIITRPPPSTAWLLSPTAVAAIRRDPRAGLQCAVETMPDGAFEVGPVGLQSVDRARLQAALTSVHGRTQGARRPAVLIPTGWVRSHLFELADLPRRQADLEQVVSWRLKKLLPVLPTELRKSTIPFPGPEHRRRLLCMVGVERAFSDLEACFAAAGVEPGVITPRLFAIARSAGSGVRLVVQHETGYLSLLLLVDEVPQLLRTKPLVAASATSSGVDRELQQTLRYLREELGIVEDLEVSVLAGDDGMQHELEDWWSSRDGVSLARLDVPPTTTGGAVRLPASDLAAALRMIDGNSR